MTPFVRKLLVVLSVFASLAGTARAAPPLPGVEDEAGLFKPETLEKAREQIQEIRDTFHLDLSIESIPAVPAADHRRVHGMSSRELAHYFDKWAKERAAAAGVDGVYILICNDPKHVQVSVWPESRDATVPARDRERLRREMAHNLRKEPDQTLLHAIAEVRTTIQRHQPVEAPSTSSTGVVLGVILAIVISWVILGIWRAKLAVHDAADRAAEKVGRGPFMPGLLGGMFGAVAGHWIYDRLFYGGSRHRMEPSPAPGEANVTDNPVLKDDESAPV